MAKLNTPTEGGKSTLAPADLFTGRYTTEGTSGAYFKNSNGLLIKVCERKDYTPLRPRLYLMSRANDGKFKYLTSLYPIAPETYRAEISRLYFSVVLNSEGVHVQRA
jgi:hypothetical protein